MTLETDLKSLASAISKKAQDKDTPLQNSTDALKALTGLYAVLNKNKSNASDNDGDDMPSFDTFSAAVKEPENGSAVSMEAGNRRRKRADA